MKKQYILFSIIFLFVVLSLSNVSAFFTDEHTFFSTKGIKETAGEVSTTCEGREQIVMDGNFAADIFVIHYTDKNKVQSYISTHTRGSGYQNCLEWAGSDIDLICFCYGVGLHNTQDHFTHDVGGVVPKYISRYFSSNLVGHMTIEDNFDIKFLEYKKNEPLISSGAVSFYNKALLDNTIFKDKKYVDLLVRMTGLTESEVIRDANLIANGYKGQGFYNTVYKEKLSLPSTFWIISLIILITPLVLLFIFIYIPFVLRIPTTKWKWLLFLCFLLVSLIGVLLIISIYSGDTWNWVRLSVRAVPIVISNNDIKYYDNIVQVATNNFIKDGVLRTDDNSGLSYADRNGQWHEGALGAAEKPFLYIGLPLIIGLLTLFFLFLIFKTFRTKPITSTPMKILNIAGYSMLIIIVAASVYLIINATIIK